MPYTLEDDEIAVLIKPLGKGQIGTCICKSDDHAMTNNELSDAMGVGLAMIGLFELLNDDDEDVYEDVKHALEEKVQTLLENNNNNNPSKVIATKPLYTAEGNILTLNAFTRTKGSC